MMPTNGATVSTADKLKRCWYSFFFVPRSTTALSIFRISYATLALCNLILLKDDLLTWYGSQHAMISFETSRLCLPNLPTVCLLSLAPYTDGTLYVFYAISVCAALTLLLGWHTRISALVLFITMQSFCRRNGFIINGCDELMSEIALYLSVSHAGKDLSVEKFVSRRRGTWRANRYAPWAQRLLQCQIALVYGKSLYSRLGQPAWLDGTCVGLVLQSKELQHFPIPVEIATSAMFSKFATWSTLAIEFCLCTLIWYRKTRYWTIFIGIVFHLGLEYAVNIPIFQWLMIACLLTFVEDGYFKAIGRRLRKYLPSNNRRSNPGVQLPPGVQPE